MGQPSPVETGPPIRFQEGVYRHLPPRPSLRIGPTRQRKATGADHPSRQQRCSSRLAPFTTLPALRAAFRAVRSICVVVLVR